MIYGYARVSTSDQNLDRQQDALYNYGIDMLYCEKLSGTKKSRPELDRLLKDLQEGDTVVIECLSRLGRSVKNLSELMEIFNEKNNRLLKHFYINSFVLPTRYKGILVIFPSLRYPRLE